jgi:hypothetical protein
MTEYTGDMRMKRKQNERSHEGRKLYTSLLLVLLALVSVSAATVAWFTIADRTKLRSMNLEITSGANLRFDLDAHDTFDEYVKTLSFEQIANRIAKEKGFDMQTVPLQPVTTANYSTFTLEDGTVMENDSGAYLEFTLHFMASQDMLVHLTSANSSGNTDGTLISSDNSALPQAMRVSFTADNSVYVYDPGMDAGSTALKDGRIFGLASAAQMVPNNDNAMFYLEEGVDKPVQVHIWIEGTDESCTDELQGADYSIQLRFIGTDSDNNILDGEDSGTDTDETENN